MDHGLVGPHGVNAASPVAWGRSFGIKVAHTFPIVMDGHVTEQAKTKLAVMRPAVSLESGAENNSLIYGCCILSYHLSNCLIPTATSSPSAAVVGISVGVPILLLLTVAIVFILWRRKRPSEPKITEGTMEEEEEGSWSARPPGDGPQTSADCAESALQDPCFPPHFVLKKGQDLRAKAKKMSENEKELEREYKWMLNHVMEKIWKESKISLQEKNQCHNRYLDIGSPAKIFFCKSVSYVLFLQLPTTTTTYP